MAADDVEQLQLAHRGKSLEEVFAAAEHHHAVRRRRAFVQWPSAQRVQ
jgi:hypothetical protein